MTREEAEIYAQDMSYEDAIHNLFRAKCVPYKKATFTKIHELLEKISVPKGERGEYIKKEDALSDKGLAEFHYFEDYLKMRKYLNSLPTYSILEREEGEREVDEDGNVNCPFCGMSVYDNFCSHCGAKMRG